MKENKTHSVIFKILLIIIAAGSILAAIKCIFVGFQIDEEYAFTLSYRLIRGDRLLTEVWDPHQTSAFLLSLIEWIWIKLTGSNEYLILWCRAVTTLIYAAISFYLYKTLRLFTDKSYSFLISVCVFGILPKDFIIPEFSLMMSWSLLLIIIALIRLRHYKRDKINFRIIALSVILGLSCVALTLSYPSCIIIVPAVLIYVLINRKNYNKPVPVIFIATMAVVGVAYFAYLLSYMTLPQMLQNIKDALHACGSHDQTMLERILEVGADLLAFTVISLAVAPVSLIVMAVTGAFKRKDNSDKIPFAITLTAYTGMIGAVLQIVFTLLKPVRISMGYDNYFFFLIILLAVIMALIYKDADKNKDFSFAILISILGLAAIMIITNMNSFRSVKYLTGAIAISLLIIVCIAAKQNSLRLKKLVSVFLIVTAFCITFYKGIFYSGNGSDNWNITDIGYIVKNGAAKGVVTEYMTGYIYDYSTTAWDKYVKDGDTVLLWDLSTGGYFIKDVNIGSYTTISTPTYYMDSLKKYWENNPDKYPDVIIVSGWFGGLRVQDIDGFLDWIENEYATEKYIDDYHRFYIR